MFHFLFGFLAEAVKLEPWKWNRGSGTAEVVDRGSGSPRKWYSRKWYRGSGTAEVVFRGSGIVPVGQNMFHF